MIVSKFEPHKTKKSDFCSCWKCWHESWQIIFKSERCTWLYRLSAASLYFIVAWFRLMIMVEVIWFSMGETALKIELNELEKLSVVVFGQGKIAHFQPNEKLLVYWWSSKIFCKFWPRFCINYFNDLQNYKHEKRLETEVSSLRNPVIMREIKLRLTFGDRCSTNWAIPLNI